MPIKKEKKSKKRATCGLHWYTVISVNRLWTIILMKINQWQENPILINYLSINFC